MKMVSVNEEAPVLVKAKIEINADPETVWNIIANIEAWPQWNPDVKSARLQGEFKPGTQFLWKAGPAKITSLIQEVNPPHTLAWTGKIMGINAIHVWDIRVVNDKTIVQTEESWDGLMSPAMHDQLEEMLEKSLYSALENLKTECERV
jgi:hypothetical protein